MSGAEHGFSASSRIIRFEMLGIAVKYDIKSMYFSTATEL